MVAQAPIADRYEIKELLGQGGMGVVYRALDLKTKSQVALKTMKDASDPAAVEMFEKEWALLAGLSHPNIIDIRDVGEIEENGQRKPFFVMPLLKGATLATLIDDSSARLTVERLVAIITQVCRGLQVAHDHGLVHRDIKPSNIFVMEDDTAKIIDFGVVHLTGTHSVTGHKGTWLYMAPEQVDLKPATPAADLFSVGVVCYEALTGKKPFARPTPMETVEAIRAYIPPPASELNPAVSQLVSMVVHKAMAKEPIHRFVNARDLGDTLQKAFLNQPIERFDPARIQPRIERAKKALSDGDEVFAGEILTGLQAEGNIGLEITLLQGQIEQRTKQKRIRQLLESARTRVEQDEIPLAFEKIQEILSIDQDNPEAIALRSAIEKRRNERQIESWMGLARKHLDRHDFSEARQALREVLRLHPADTAAGDLLAETDRREQQSLRIRSEREQLYGSAMRAYQYGEVSSALSKLERLLELGNQTPDASVPERDAAYQVFYNQVRTERDAIQNAYESVRRHLAEKAFTRALEICDEFSNRYPNDALFQALKLEAVDQERQEQSAYIAEVGRRVDAEADLDRKVSILKEACERYPAEQQFQQSLKITRERRDLVFSIIAKSRQYEERNQFAEAVGQWEILRSLYPRYPGIDIEIAQLTRRREAQVKDESKARLVEAIDRALDSNDFQRALDLAVSALAENPQDAEFAGLERRAREGLERSVQARTLLTQGQQLIEESRFEEAAEVLRRASAADPKSTLVRDTLLTSLVEQARPLIERDWRKAEPLVQQACELDATHPGGRSLRVLLLDAKRAEYVPQCLAEARDLQQDGQTEAALEKIEAALSQYPNDARLLQFHTSLRQSIRQVHSQQERRQDIETLRRIREDAETRTVHDDWKSILERSQSISVKYPDDPEVGVVASEIQQRVNASAPRNAVVPAPMPHTRKAPAIKVWLRSTASGADILARKASARFSRLYVRWPEFRAAAAARLKPVSGLRSAWGPSALIVSIAAAVIVLAILSRKPLPPPRPRSAQPKLVLVRLRVTPEDAIVMVDGKVRTGQLQLMPGVSYYVKATKLGYQDRELSLQAVPEWNLALEPAPVHINLATAEKSGEVFLDDQKKGDLADGIAQDVLAPPDSNEHTLKIKNGATEILSLTYTAEPAKEPSVKAILSRDVQAVTSLGTSATLYTSTLGLKANLAGQPAQAIPSEGMKLGLAETNHEVAFDSKDLSNLPVALESFPSLTITSHPQVAVIKIACPVENARLLIDGRDGKWGCRDKFWTVRRPPGDHTVKILADGYKDFEGKITLNLGVNPALSPILNFVVTAATLEVQSGTPQATIYIDQENKGQLNDSGGKTLNDIQPGKHTVRIEKEGFEPLTDEIIFTARVTTTVSNDKAKLRPFGALTFAITPANATVTYSLADGSPRAVENSKTYKVRAGQYRVEASQDGYERQSVDIQVEPGKDTPVHLNLVSSAKPDPRKIQPTPQPVTGRQAFEKSGDIVVNGQWLAKQNSNDYAFLKEGFRHITFTFGNPASRRFRGKTKIEWVAHYVDSSNMFQFQLDRDGISCHEMAKGKLSTKKSTKHEENTSYIIDLTVESDKITVVENGSLQICILPGHDLTLGKVGLKGNIESFLVSAR